MKALRQTCTLLASSLILHTGLFLSPADAKAAKPVHIDSHLQSYRDDTSALMTLKLDLGRWLKSSDYLLKDMQVNVKTTSDDASGTSKTDTMSSLNEINDMSKSELGVDIFWDVLTNLGEHMSLAYRPFPGRAGDVLLNLELRSGDRAAKVIEKVYQKASAEAGPFELLRESYGPYTLYTLVLDEAEDFGRLQLAICGNHLLASLAPDATQLKNMLYLSAVLPAESRFKLVNQAYFKPVEKSLQDTSLWFYADAMGLYQLLETFGAEELDDALSSGDMAAIKALVPLYRGLGLGLDIESNGLFFKSFVAPDQAQLSPVQKKYHQALQASPAESLQKLLKKVPGSQVFFTGAENVDLAFKQPFPIEPALLEQSEMLKDADLSGLGEMMQGFVGVDPGKDLEPYLDGRYGLAVFEANDTPQSVFYLGIKPNQAEAFENNLMSKFKFGLGGLFGMLEEDLAEMGEAEAALDAEAIRFVRQESYKGTQLYALTGLPELDEMKEWVQPMAARSGNLWMLAQTPLALKTALDTQAGGGAKLEQMMRQTDSQSASSYFFLDVSRVLDLVALFAGEDEEISELVDLMRAWKSLYASSKTQADGTEGQLVLDIDFKSIDWNSPLIKSLMDGGSESYDDDDDDSYDDDDDDDDDDSYDDDSDE